MKYLFLFLLLLPSVVAAQVQIALDETTAAKRRLPILMVDATDGETAETGLTLTCTISKAGASFGAHSGSVSEVSGGQYYLQLGSGDVDTQGYLAYLCTGSGAKDYRGLAEIVPYSFSAAEIAQIRSALGVDGAKTTAVGGQLQDVLTDTGTSGVVIASGQTVATVTTLNGHTPQTGDCYARLGTPAGASISADIAAAKGDTAAILDDTGTTGVKVATNGLDNGAITTAAGNKIADHVLRRNAANVEASSDGDPLSCQSLYGSTSHMNRVRNATGVIEFYRADKSTVFCSRATTTDAGANPITEIN